MFSRRLSWTHPTNRLTLLLEEKRAAGARILDLTESNPTRVGIEYPLPDLAAALAAGADAPYEPAPRGLPTARAAVARHCGRHGAATPPDRVVLTASTSEAYAFLLKLLADPGDAILVPSPSYPLFDYLAALESVRAVPYALGYDGGWRFDPAALEYAAREAGPHGPRAVVVVNPNNPTGSALRRADLELLDAFAARRGIPIVSDEVFLDYLHGPPAVDPAGAPVSALAGAGAIDGGGSLRFVLGGLSKSCGLPQLKLGWIIATGPDPAAREAIDRLELIADTYLSAGTPVMQAAPRLLELGESIRGRIHARIEENRSHLLERAGGSACRVQESDGGWSAVLQVPATRPEEEIVLALLRDDDVLVHPGYFFDFAREAFVVLSLLPPPAEFREAVARLLARAAAVCPGPRRGV